MSLGVHRVAVSQSFTVGPPGPQVTPAGVNPLSLMITYALVTLLLRDSRRAGGAFGGGEGASQLDSLPRPSSSPDLGFLFLSQWIRWLGALRDTSAVARFVVAIGALLFSE
jgi:hypothetical protein